MSPAIGNPVTLEHLVYSWANRTISGRGNGVVLASTGWPTGLSVSGDDELADLVAYIPPAELKRLTAGDSVPTSFEVWEHPRLGHVIAARRDAGRDSSGRPGRTVVHVALDPLHHLDARQSLELASSGLVREWSLDAEVVDGAPPLAIDLLAVAEWSRPASDEQRQVVMTALAAILCALDDGKRAVLVHDDATSSESVLSALLHYLPKALKRNLTFSSFRFDTFNSPFQVTFALRGRSTVRPDAIGPVRYVDLDGNGSSDLWRPTGQHLQVADAVVTAVDGGEAIPDGVVAMNQITEWTVCRELGQRDPGTLTLGDALELLRATTSASWTDRPAVLRRAALELARSAVEPDLADAIGVLPVDERRMLVSALYSGLGTVGALGSTLQRARLTASLRASDGPSGLQVSSLLIDALSRLIALNSPDGDAATAHLLSTCTMTERMSLADEPTLVNRVLRDDVGALERVSDLTWTTQGWAAAHPVVAKHVAANYTHLSVTRASQGLSRGATSPRLVADLLAVPNAQVFTDIAIAAFAQPELAMIAARWRLDSAVPDVVRVELDRRFAPQGGRAQLAAGMGWSDTRHALTSRAPSANLGRFPINPIVTDQSEPAAVRPPERNSSWIAPATSTGNEYWLKTQFPHARPLDRWASPPRTSDYARSLAFEKQTPSKRRAGSDVTRLWVLGARLSSQVVSAVAFLWVGTSNGSAWAVAFAAIATVVALAVALWPSRESLPLRPKSGGRTKQPRGRAGH